MVELSEDVTAIVMVLVPVVNEIAADAVPDATIVPFTVMVALASADAAVIVVLLVPVLTLPV